MASTKLNNSHTADQMKRYDSLVDATRPLQAKDWEFVLSREYRKDQSLQKRIISFLRKIRSKGPTAPESKNIRGTDYLRINQILRSRFILIAERKNWGKNGQWFPSTKLGLFRRPRKQKPKKKKTREKKQVGYILLIGEVQSSPQWRQDEEYRQMQRQDPDGHMGRPMFHSGGAFR